MTAAPAPEAIGFRAEIKQLLGTGAPVPSRRTACADCTAASSWKRPGERMPAACRSSDSASPIMPASHCEVSCAASGT